MSAKARPTSAQSRTAWGDYGSARPDSQFDFGQDGIRDDPDLTPTAIDDDTSYMNGDKGKGKSGTVATTGGGKKSKSCLGKIGSGIRSLWATRQTEDVKDDRELHVKTTLRELIVYIVFLVILCVVTFCMTSTTMYYYTKVMNDLFLDTTHSGGGSFRTITSVEDFWKFAKGPLLKGLYWETWYNNQTVPDDQLGYIYYENKLLGVPRLRQLQVHSNSCVVHSDFTQLIRDCYEQYSESLENKEPFGEKDNYTGWYYRSEDDLDGFSHWGRIATYSGAGYVQDLTQNKTESEAVINYLFDKRWIQRGTRVLFIDFTVYNANINLFCVIRLAVEFPPTGGAIPYATMRTVKLIRYVSVRDYFVMACEFIFCLFIFYYMIEESIEIKKHKFAYFKSVWNILDILVIAIAIVCVVFNIYRTLKVDDLLKELLDKPNQYPDFQFLSYGQTQFDNAIAIAVFFAWIKIFKYISFNKTMTQLSSTLGKCAKDLAGFAVMFFIIFLAFTQLGYLLFGTQVKDFSNFQNSFFTLFRIILGDFDFDQLEAANRVLGPIFFMLFVFFVFFVLINMFLAIINDTYSEVKGDMANQKNEFEMSDYFKRGYDKMLSKLNFKHDKIVDIQKALHSADINNDKQVDFDEWRTDLKTRGYADGEIEALFAKYDIDGDRVLDEEEQRRMQADLNCQKNALSKEYDELEKNQRPESTRSRVSFNDDSADDSEDEDSHTKSSRSGPSQSVSYEEFTVLSRRVDRMEHSIGSIVSKIDAVLVKLEAMEKAKLKRRETMGKILDSITESDGTSDEVKREQMERLVREELERWDSESSITPQPSGRGASPSSSGRGGARSRSRPGSGGNALSDKSVVLVEETDGAAVTDMEKRSKEGTVLQLEVDNADAEADGESLPSETCEVVSETSERPGSRDGELVSHTDTLMEQLSSSEPDIMSSTDHSLPSSPYPIERANESVVMIGSDLPECSNKKEKVECKIMSSTDFSLPSSPYPIERANESVVIGSDLPDSIERANESVVIGSDLSECSNKNEKFECKTEHPAAVADIAEDKDVTLNTSMHSVPLAIPTKPLVIPTKPVVISTKPVVIPTKPVVIPTETLVIPRAKSASRSAKSDIKGTKANANSLHNNSPNLKPVHDNNSDPNVHSNDLVIPTETPVIPRAKSATRSAKSSDVKGTKANANSLRNNSPNPKPVHDNNSDPNVHSHDDQDGKGKKYAAISHAPFKTKRPCESNVFKRLYRSEPISADASDEKVTELNHNSQSSTGSKSGGKAQSGMPKEIAAGGSRNVLCVEPVPLRRPLDTVVNMAASASANTPTASAPSKTSVSVRASCKTPVMEKVSTAVFV